MNGGRPTDSSATRRLSDSKRILVLLSAVVLVGASVVAVGGAVADSTQTRPIPGAGNENAGGTTPTTMTNRAEETTTAETPATTTTGTGETTTAPSEPTTTSTEDEVNRTTRSGERRNNTTRSPKKGRTPGETTASSRIAGVGGSNESPTTPPTGPPSESSDPGKSGATGPPSDIERGPKVSVSRADPAAVDGVVRNVRVRNVEAYQPVSVDVSPTEHLADVTFDTVEVTPTTDASFTLNVTASDEPIASETPVTNLSGRAEPLAFVSVDHSIADRNVGNVTFRFRVRKERVNASELDEVALYRYHGGSWNALPTTLENVTDDHFVYQVRSPGLSEFAAGKQQPQFEITDAGFEFTTLSVGDALEVRVRITNDGDADGTFTADLVLDNETVASHRLTIAADGMRQTTFERQVAEPGTYEVYVNDFHVGDVTVNESVATGDGTTSDIEASAGEDGDTTHRGSTTGVPGFGLWTAVGSLVAALVGVRRFGSESQRGEG